MGTFVGTPNELQRLKSDVTTYDTAIKKAVANLRVALPGIIQSFDPDEQTVVVKVAVKDNVTLNGQSKDVDIPFLVDVPIVLPSAGIFTLTFPVTAGDECLVIFADYCINGWWQNGAADSAQTQEVYRRHSLSDAFAILGCWSQPNVLPNYSTVAAELRSNDGTVKVSVHESSITVSAPTVNVTGASQVNVNGSGNTFIEGRNFLEHTHSGVTTGAGVSGPVV